MTDDWDCASELPSEGDVFLEPFEMDKEHLVETLQALKTIVVPDNWPGIDAVIDGLQNATNDFPKLQAIGLLNPLKGDGLRWALNSLGGISLEKARGRRA